MSASVKLAKEIDEPDIGQPSAECQFRGLPGASWSYDKCVVRKERCAVQVSRSHLCMMSRLLRPCRLVRLLRMIEQVKIIAKLYRYRGGSAQSDETAGILKRLKDETSADSTALEKKGLDRKTNHQELMKTETKETDEVAKAVEGQEKADALPILMRPPPWRDKQATIEYGRKSKRRCDKGESMLWLAASYLEYKATIQEGVIHFMPHSTLWNVLEQFKTQIPEALRK